MPNREADGAAIGFYADVNGTTTLVAARRSFELSDTADTIDKTHVDNMQVGATIRSVNTGTMTVDLISTRELKVANRGTIKGGGDLTWGDTDVTDNGDGTHDVTFSGSGSPSQGDVLLVPSPNGSNRYVYDRGEWEVSLETVVLIDPGTGDFAPSHQALLDANRNGSVIGVKIERPKTDGTAASESGDAIVTEYQSTYPHDGIATASITVKGQGPLTPDGN
jgi:predicted secreted protein